MRMLLYHQGTCCPSTHKLPSLSAFRDETCRRSRVRMPQTLYLHITLTRDRKHWRQLDDFHSLTDLKIHVSSHKEPQITAGLRSVCWKVCSLTQSPGFVAYDNARSSSSSRHSTARHGRTTSPSRAEPTTRCAHITCAPSNTRMSSNHR